MLYMVECDFGDPAQEDAWNDWYSGEKLDELLANPGFTATQRFRALTPRPAAYLAVHSIASVAVFTDPAYTSGGGGRFGDWDPALMTNWSRRLFDGLAQSPPVGPDACLLLMDGDGDAPPSVDLTWLRGLDWDTAGRYRNAVALDASVSRRGIGVIERSRLSDLPEMPGLWAFEPLTELKRKQAGGEVIG